MQTFSSTATKPRTTGQGHTAVTGTVWPAWVYNTYVFPIDPFTVIVSITIVHA